MHAGDAGGRAEVSGRYVVMGVSGAGKSVVGAGLARALGVPFVEGDEYHPPENVQRMAAGIPLTDADRAAWLSSLAEQLEAADCAGHGVVISCSALKKAYRDRLRANGRDVQFIFLHGPRAVLVERLAGREGHFMPAALLESQLATLEVPSADERVWSHDIRESPEEIVRSVMAQIL